MSRRTWSLGISSRPRRVRTISLAGRIGFHFCLRISFGTEASSGIEENVKAEVSQVESGDLGPKENARDSKNRRTADFHKQSPRSQPVFHGQSVQRSRPKRRKIEHPEGLVRVHCLLAQRAGVGIMDWSRSQL